MTTSGTYNFLSVKVELLIREAFERIGIPGEMVEYQKLDSAMRSLNFMFSHWMARGVNLWTLETAFIPLVPGQKQYTLPPQVKNLTQVSLRTSWRQLGGTALSTWGGDAAHAFDGDWKTACTQTATGIIKYDYGAGNLQTITFMGIQSNVSVNCIITVGASVNGVDFLQLMQIPLQTYPVINYESQTYGLTQWFEIPNPGAYKAYSITNLSPPNLLNVQEIYFNNMVQDTPLSEVSRSEYLAYPMKDQTGRPTCYYLDRQIIPQLYLWPVPSSLYNCLMISYEKMLQDVGTVTNTLELPSRFYEALIWGLAHRMACKYAPDKNNYAKQYEEETLSIAMRDDTERTPISIYGDVNG